jgi:hypothetical protein
MAALIVGAIFLVGAGFLLWVVACKLFLLEADLNAGNPSDGLTVWLTDEQKLALWHVARLGFLSPADGAAARTLFSHHMIQRDPAFSLTPLGKTRNEELSNGEMLSLESKACPPVSPRLHHLVLAVVALALGFVFITQREVFNSAIAIVGAVVAALPMILKLLSQFGGGANQG